MINFDLGIFPIKIVIVKNFILETVIIEKDSVYIEIALTEQNIVVLL